MNGKQLLYGLLIPAGLLLPQGLKAQCDHKVTAKADFAFATNNFVEAVKLYQKSLGRAKDKELKSCITLQIARSYLRFNEYKKAETTLRKLVNTKGVNLDPEVYYQYALVLKNLARYEEALTWFKKFAEAKPGDSRGEIGIKSCEMAIAWRNNPTCYQVENMQQWNTKQMDFSPFIASKKGDQIIITSNRDFKPADKKTKDDVGVHGGLSEDLWLIQAKKSSGRARRGQAAGPMEWEIPVRLEFGISSEHSEGSGTMDSRYSNLFFTRCFGDRKNGTGCRIFSARRSGAKFQPPAQVSIPGFPDSVVTGHPTISNDGRFIVFASNVGGGYGGMDLYAAPLNRGKVGKPVNLGPAINSPEDDMFPHLRADNTLYFSSDRPEGMGGLDIYKASVVGELNFQKAEEIWGHVENMRYPINSEGDDFGIFFEKGKEAGYLSSNRSGGKGSDDIYAFSVPQATITLSGTVFDKDTRQPIPEAKVELVDQEGNVITVTTDRVGFYKKDIPFGVRYEMKATKQGYFYDINRADVTNLDPLKTCRDTNVTADFYLKTTKVNLEFEIQFVFDKEYPLPEFDPDSLNAILRVLQENPHIAVEIGAHTDARGSDDYNRKLADRRAKWIVDWLVKKGVEPERLTAKGYGEDEPRELTKAFKGLKSGRIFPKGTKLTEEFINELKTKEGEMVFEDAHTLNRRVTMKILREDYKSKRKPKDDDDDSDESED